MTSITRLSKKRKKERYCMSLPGRGLPQTVQRSNGTREKKGRCQSKITRRAKAVKGGSLHFFWRGRGGKKNGADLPHAGGKGEPKAQLKTTRPSGREGKNSVVLPQQGKKKIGPVVPFPRQPLKTFLLPLAEGEENC